MNKTYHTFLILSAIGLLSLGSYVYFSDSLRVHADTPVFPDSSLVSQNDLSTNPSDAAIAADTSFLLTLASLTSIKIDTTFFTNDAFMKLDDHTVSLEPVEAGRENPFAPIDTSVKNKTIAFPPVTTNVPALITNKTATLSGTVTDSTTTTNLYFEYGPTPTLGKTTAQVKPSLTDTFVTTIKGLNPQTTYFYRAVGKIDNKLSYGEVVTFETSL